MSISSVKIQKTDKKSFDILKKTFDPKYKGEWVATPQNINVFLNIYIKEKYKEDLFFLEYFTLYAVYNPPEINHSIFTVNLKETEEKAFNRITRDTVNKQPMLSFINAYKNSMKKFHYFNIRMGIKERTGDFTYHSVSAIYDKISNRIDFFNTLLNEFNIKAFNEQFKIFFKAVYGKDVKIKYTQKCHRLAVEEFYNSCESIYKNTNFDIDGPCGIWTLWFLDMRLSNKHLSYKEVLDKALEYFMNKRKHQAICKVIRNYAIFADKIMKKYTLKIDSKNKHIEIIYKDTSKNNRIIKMILGGLSLFILTGLAYRKLKNN